MLLLDTGASVTGVYAGGPDYALGHLRPLCDQQQRHPCDLDDNLRDLVVPRSRSLRAAQR